MRRRLKQTEYHFDDYKEREYEDSEDIDCAKETAFRYKQILLPEIKNTSKSFVTLENALRQIFYHENNKKHDYNFTLKYEGSSIATLKSISGSVSVNSIVLTHEFPGVLSKDLLLTAISKIGAESGSTNLFRLLLDNELGLLLQDK